MNDVIEVWSRSGENLEAIASIVLEIQFLEAQSRLIVTHAFSRKRVLLQLLRHVLRSPYTSAILTVFTRVLMFTCNQLILHTI